jgi:ABC-2 type transport system permease protein
MDLPPWVHNLSPLKHIARLPLDEFTWPPAVILTAIATALITLGLLGFRQRDVETR